MISRISCLVLAIVLMTVVAGCDSNPDGPSVKSTGVAPNTPKVSKTEGAKVPRSAATKSQGANPNEP